MTERTPEQIIKNFIALDRFHHKLLEKQVGDCGMHRSQHAILLYIFHLEHAPSQKEIADHFSVSPAAVAVSMKKLENGGYIERKSQQNDSRFNEIIITEKGKEILRKTKSLVDLVDRKMFDDFTDEEYDIFYKCLDKMQNNLLNFEKGEQ